VGGGYAYSQSAGTTTIDGTLTASSGINVTGGTIEGAGTLSGNVSVGGSGTTPALNIGDSGKAGLLVITGAYAQLATASVNAFIGGTTVGTGYSQLQVSGTATLAGTLTVALASGFTPTIGSTFTVLTASSISGSFSNSTIAINGSEHFNVSYTSTGVVLTVASGAAPLSGPLQSVLVPALPRRQPIVVGGLRHWIGGVPNHGDHIFGGEMGNDRPRSGAVLAGGGFRRSEGLEAVAKLPRMPSPVAATWEHKLPVVPVIRQQSGLGSQSAPNSNNWTAPVRAVSSLRMPTNGSLIPRAPVRILPPILPRLQR
jgi:hypothetical protein